MSTIRGHCLKGSLVLLTIIVAAGATRRSTAQTWIDWRAAGPFVCRADFPLDGMQGLFNDLAQLQQDLVRYLGVPPAKEPIDLYLFRDQHSYRRFLGRHFPQVPYRRALYVKSGGTGMVFTYRSSELAVDMRHECTHALLHASLPMVPLWLDEGLAEYFEVPPAERAFDNPHLSAVRWSVRLGIVSNPRDLENKDSLDEMGGSEYRNAWAWTHFMLHGPPEAHDELIRFISDIQAQTPPGLLSRRLEQRLPDLERRFSAHFRNWKR